MSIDKRFLRRAVWVTMIAIAVSALTWWLFGWTKYGALESVYTAHRFFGSVTRIEADTNIDGNPDWVAHFPWSAHVTVWGGFEACDDRPMREAYDRDHDGQWDLWGYKQLLDEDGGVRWLFEIDHNYDGMADAELEGPCEDYGELLHSAFTGDGDSNR
jgi:hypothetical protein